MRTITLLLAMAWSVQSLAETLWHMPTPYGDRNFHTANIIEFAQQVKKATNGEFVIKIHSGGSLFKHPEIATVVRRGLVPIGELLMSRLSNENPVYELDSIPFLAAGYDQAELLWQATRPAIEEALAERGMILLFAVPWPPQGIYAGKELLSSADIRGLRVRAYNRTTEQLAQLAGGIPTQVEVPDIPTAFSTGRVDAMITSSSTGANTQAWDYVSHFHDANAWLVKNMVVVNQQAFEALPAPQQQALLAAASAAEQRGWQASREENRAKIAVMAEHGMTIVPINQTLASELKAMGVQMAQEWLERAGEEGRALMESYRATLNNKQLNQPREIKAKGAQ